MQIDHYLYIYTNLVKDLNTNQISTNAISPYYYRIS